MIADTEPEENPRADVFDLLNIVPYVRKFKSSESFLWSPDILLMKEDPVTGAALDTSQLIKLNFFKVRSIFSLA